MDNVTPVTRALCVPRKDQRLSRERAVRAHAEHCMSKKEYYDTLGLPATAGKPEIRAAFRALALKYHPDMCAAVRFTSLITATESTKHAVVSPETLPPQLRSNMTGYVQPQRRS